MAAISAVLHLAPWQSGDFPPEFASIRPVLVVLQPVLNWTFLMLVWCGLYFGALAVRAHRSAELRESELARALQLSELGRLKAQLNPHYLFNALNTVRALIVIDASAAQEAVTRLARTLRYTLGAGEEDLIGLAQELETVEDYLALESLRLGDRLHVAWEISDAARGARIPVMLLQTLIENAIKHGIAELEAGGTLTVAADLKARVLRLCVENPCPRSQAPVRPEGIGLRNATERLRHLYGPNACLELGISAPADPASPARAVATVTIRYAA